MSATDAIASISTVIAVVALGISYATHRDSVRAAARPVLVFSMVSTFRWEVRNVGAGPAINVIVSDVRADRDTETVTNCYPLAAGAASQLTWLRAGHELAALYTDVYGREFTTFCNGNTNRVMNGSDGRDWAIDTQEWIQRLRPTGGVASLSPRDLRTKTSWDLDILRNEVFARHGLAFTREDLATHFAQQPWYTPTTTSQAEISEKLTDEQKYHVYLVGEYQQLRSLRTRSD
jgi:hypothetical protein